MKKVVLLFTAFLLTVSVFAQYRNVTLPEKPKQPGYRDYDNQQSGFWCAIEGEGASSVMASSRNMQFAALSFTGGYRLSQYLRLGAGLGCRYYVNNANVRNTDNKFGIPIYANARGNFISASDRDGVPFWSLNISGITHEGFFASPTIGYSFGGLRNNFLVGITYCITSFKNSSKTNMGYSYFGIKLGYEF